MGDAESLCWAIGFFKGQVRGVHGHTGFFFNTSIKKNPKISDAILGGMETIKQLLCNY